MLRMEEGAGCVRARGNAPVLPGHAFLIADVESASFPKDADPADE